MYRALKSDGFIQGKRSALSHVELWPSSSEDDKNLLSLRFIGYSLKTSTPRRLNARPIPRRSRLSGSALGGITLLNTDTHDYHQDEAARDIPRSTVPGRRPCPLDHVLPEARFHIRRAVGRVLRHWSAGRAGASPEGSAQERRRAPTPAC